MLPPRYSKKKSITVSVSTGGKSASLSMAELMVRDRFSLGNTEMSVCETVPSLSLSCHSDSDLVHGHSSNWGSVIGHTQDTTQHGAHFQSLRTPITRGPRL